MRVFLFVKSVIIAVGLIVAAAYSSGAVAGQAAVLEAKVTANANGTYAVSATIYHKDTGWDHYADKFDVLTSDGTVIATRVLYHPHVDEQPFTRSIGNVQAPVGTTEIVIRAHDSVHGDGERTFTIKLPRRK
jgi:hypothetical protein